MIMSAFLQFCSFVVCILYSIKTYFQWLNQKEYYHRLWGSKYFDKQIKSININFKGILG